MWSPSPTPAGSEVTTEGEVLEVGSDSKTGSDEGGIRQRNK